MSDIAGPKETARAVDSTDWLKTAAILVVVIDHVGLFFIEDDTWWRVAGRMAAPIFFFLIGYSRRTSTPWTWLAIGAGLTFLESWGNGWAWVPVNILVSFAAIRWCRPLLDRLASGSLPVFGLLLAGLVALHPLAERALEYGTVGWLWALLGLCQREFADNGGQWAYRRLAAAITVAPAYVWFEQAAFEFAPFPTTVVALGTVILCLWLCSFRRGPSPVQPPWPATSMLHFTGHYTLEIYAIQLAASEVLGILELVP